MIRLQVHHPGDHTLIVGYVELDHIDAKAIVELAHPELMCIMTPPSMEARIAELQADKDQIAQVLGAAKWEGPLMAAQRVMAFVRSINDEPPKPTQPADHGDDAAVSAMDDAYQPVCSVSMPEMPAHTEGLAAILAAIRRGEVPGVMTADGGFYGRMAARATTERDQWKARAEKAEAMAQHNLEAAGLAEDKAQRWLEESDRLAAEVEALKSRKVVMPPIVWASEYGVWMLRRCDVHDAIRAAGIAVEEA